MCFVLFLCSVIAVMKIEEEEDALVVMVTAMMTEHLKEAVAKVCGWSEECEVCRV